MRFLLLLLLNSQIVAATPDPGWCGVAPFESGIWDPLHKVCIKHDAEFNAHKANEPNDGFFQTSIDFVSGAIITTAKDQAIAVLATIEVVPYSILAVLGGGILWAWASLDPRK